jgi:galactitol-specific phosphotransferase system IIC component
VVRGGTVYFLLILVFLALIFFRKRDKDISEGIRISLET